MEPTLVDGGRLTRRECIVMRNGGKKRKAVVGAGVNRMKRGLRLMTTTRSYYYEDQARI